MTPAELGIYDVFFAVDCYALSDRAKADLDVSSGVMNKFSDSQFVIEGYCDERGSAEYNLALCKNRISAVRDYLISLGVDSSQLKTKSYGEENPFADDSDESAWSLNRRVHFARP
ncbi:MAG: OmpA family protein [bacterium]|nr:OmpA family protein [bacterium]MCP4799046.1 OmpA family protein [bacterium]